MTPGSTIDGFLGCSEEVLNSLQDTHVLSSETVDETNTNAAADILLGRIKGMILRDTQAPPKVSISSELLPESGRDFSLCHYAYQQATLIHVYRRLYNMPSGSQPVQAAVETISDMVNDMTQGQMCNAWVAMSMPLFTIGCEAFSQSQKDFVLGKIRNLEVCIGSLHLRVIRQALEDIWKLRADLQDFDGHLCAGHLLKELKYSIILF
ncbi:fungal-specific transcription factor domain-containing protein [Hypoxylon rubiginosum]|uniref:Fungal-specific transcription factor domain-containing protein n=1 Tax=Hypoxylon rubiginosum TaxID=110542 RepID=A0ACB9YHT4_9PEZI|nr:fungal-specific transcription factor domain-containing protein [Hypoxylon rubiginosum]